MSMELNKVLDLLRGLVREVEHKTCCHEKTHRGGAIWEICDYCGAKWADDEGGKPEFAWPESVEKARAFLATHHAVEQAEAERPEVFGLERYRVERTGQGFWPYCVRAGDGTRELFVGHLKQCKRVAAQLATAFEDGKFVAGALRADRDSWAKQAEQRLADWDEMRKERDAALAKVADEKVVAQAQALGRIVDKLTQYNESLYEENTRLLAYCEKIDREVAALRARLSITPERLASGESISKMLRSIGCDGDVSYHHSKGIWNACLDELERLRRLHEK